MNIVYEENTLTAEQFNILRNINGFKYYPEHQVDKAIKNGLYNIIAKDNDTVIGMGRLVGDGFIYWYVQDVHVNPNYQGKGIGKEIMRLLENYVERNRLPDTFTTIGLTVAKGKDGFYEKLGYIPRPNENCGAGMGKLLQ